MNKVISWITLFWLWGGGLLISLLGLILSWQTALTIFCLWCGCWVVVFLSVLHHIVKAAAKIAEEKDNEDNNSD